MLISELENSLPAVDKKDYRSTNKGIFESLGKTCFVIDDDPTGNQTVYGIPLLAEWNIETLKAELEKETPTCFILTNSRSLSEKEASAVYYQVTKNIKEASQKIGRGYSIISRSDSTLRGHFLVESNAIQNAEKEDEIIHFLIPMMFEGGRMTVNDIHYINEKENLIPVSDSAFAKDHTFGYSKSNLKEWIEEKTKGNIKASSVISISLQEIRTKTVDYLANKIFQIPRGTYCIGNALNYQDLDKLCTALLYAEKKGKKIQYRTSSSFVPSFIGLPPKKLLEASEVNTASITNGGLVIVGSYVPKTSSQLSYYLKNIENDVVFELDINQFFSPNKEAYIQEISRSIDLALAKRKNIVLYTSRKLKTGKTTDETIHIASIISGSIINLVKGIQQQPRFVIAKGGITSHDIATKALNGKRSTVIGQILPGVPVWRMGKETKFPNLPYVVFPGNVGNEESLFTLIKKIT